LRKAPRVVPPEAAGSGSSRCALMTLVIVETAACVALAGARDAKIAAAIRSRVDAKKAVGMVVATIEPDGSSSMAAFGNAGPGARPLDTESVLTNSVMSNDDLGFELVAGPAK
jgi:hypothetical protein